MFFIRILAVYITIVSVKCGKFNDNEELDQIFQSNNSFILEKQYTVNMTLWTMKYRNLENVSIEGNGDGTIIKLNYQNTPNYSFINILKRSKLINIYFLIIVEGKLVYIHSEEGKESLIVSSLYDSYIYSMHIIFQPNIVYENVVPLINEVLDSTIIHFGLFFKSITVENLKQSSNYNNASTYPFLINKIKNNELNEICGLFMKGESLFTDGRNTFFLAMEISSSRLSYSFVDIINIKAERKNIEIGNYCFIGVITNTISTMILYKSFMNIDSFEYIKDNKLTRNSFINTIYKCSDIIIYGCWVRINYINKYLGINSIIENVLSSDISILNSYSLFYLQKNKNSDDINRIVYYSRRGNIRIHNSISTYNYMKYRIYKLISYDGQLYSTQPYYTPVFSNLILTSPIFIYETDLIDNLHLYLRNFSYYPKTNTICYTKMAKYEGKYVTDRWNVFMNADIMIIEKNIVEYRLSGPVFAFTEYFDYMNDWSKYYNKKNLEYSLSVFPKNNREGEINQIVVKENNKCIRILSDLHNFTSSNNIIRFKLNSECKTNVIYSISLRCYDENYRLLQIILISLDTLKKRCYKYDEISKNIFLSYLGFSIYGICIIVLFCCIYKIIRRMVRNGQLNEFIY